MPSMARRLLLLGCVLLLEPACAARAVAYDASESQKEAELAERGRDEPVPSKQSEFQKQFIATIRAEAERDSQRDERAVLSYLGSPGFRRNITVCCPTIAQLPAAEMLARLTEELRAAEVVRNFNVQQDWTSECNMSTWLRAKYDYNLWVSVKLSRTKESGALTCNYGNVCVMCV